MSPNPQEAYMSFWEHLEALRWHIIRSLIAIFGISLLAFVSKQFVMHTLVLGPSRPDFWTYQMLNKLSILLDAPSLCIGQHPLTFHSRQLAGQFTMHVAISLGLGFIGAFPYVIWELWRFISPAIQLPKRQVIYTTCLVSVLFLLGILFGYFIITPLVIQFLASYQLDSEITNFFDVSSYISTLLTLVLSCALVFQLPMVVYFLAKAGIVTAQLMHTYRRHAIVLILTVSAVITPPDVVSQVLLTIPLILLYEFSIFIAQLAAHESQQPR